MTDCITPVTGRSGCCLSTSVHGPDKRGERFSSERYSLALRDDHFHLHTGSFHHLFSFENLAVSLCEQEVRFFFLVIRGLVVCLHFK